MSMKLCIQSELQPGGVANTAMGKLDRPTEALLEHSEVLSEAACG